ncbi:oligoribonuclease [Candidatus Saccharibacteria bacterium]|nr:oligoribonuclease [Candidatus Saccharibacteria bacterium]
MSKELAIPTKLLWMDLEFTDFDYPNACVLEVSAEITDFNFVTIGNYEARVKNNPDKLVKRFKLNTFWQEFVSNRDNFLKHNDSGKDLKLVEQELLSLIDDHFDGEPPILAGNSIHSDRAVIKAHWPTLDLKLHYRMLDVSSFKTLMLGKYGVVYEKNNTHRAYDDIQASIAELQFYLDWFDKKHE